MKYLLIIILFFTTNVSAQVQYIVSEDGNCTVIGLSTDIKPTPPINATNWKFFELNTGKTYKSLSGVWVLQVVPLTINDTGGVTFSTFLRSSVAATLYQSILGFTPYNSTNPNSYISSITSGNVTTALGYTPTNPNGTSSQYTAGDGSKITFPTTTAAFTNSTNKNFVTDPQLTVIGNTSNINSGNDAPNSLYSGLVTNQAHTGDATGSTALTLATVNGNVGSFGSATQAGTFTVNAKGLVTAASNTTIAIPQSAVTNLTTDLSAKQNTLVSGTNIKTVNGNTLLGSGDLTVVGTGVLGGSESLASNFTTSSTTAASTNLSFPIAANEVFDITITGTASKATTNTGLKLAINAPVGCTIKGYLLGGGATLAAAQVPSLITAINTLGATFGTGIGVEITFQMQFRVVNSTNAGNITLQTATITSNVVTIYTGTKMTYIKSSVQ